MTAYARVEPRSGETDAAYAAVSRLVRRAEGAARWARFWRRGAEESRAIGRKLGAVLPSEAARKERAERAEARAAHLRALACEAGAGQGRDAAGKGR